MQVLVRDVRLRRLGVLLILQLQLVCVTTQASIYRSHCASKGLGLGTSRLFRGLCTADSNQHSDRQLVSTGIFIYFLTCVYVVGHIKDG